MVVRVTIVLLLSETFIEAFYSVKIVIFLQLTPIPGGFVPSPFRRIILVLINSMKPKAVTQKERCYLKSLVRPEFGLAIRPW